MKTLEDYSEIIRSIEKFVVTLDPAVRGEAFKFLLEREVGQSTREPSASSQHAAVSVNPAAITTDREIAPQELLRKSGATTLVEKAIVLGYWLEIIKGETSFSGGRLREVFTDAREQAPANPSDVVAKLERSGKFMKADKVGMTQHYRLTRTALEAVESKLTVPPA